MSTSGEPLATRKLTVKSSDGKEFKVPEAVARQSHLIDRTIKDGCANNVIPLYNVTSKILKKIIHYCIKHAGAVADDRASEVDLRNWDAKFVDVNQAILFDLMMAADYMEIENLLDLTCQVLADMIKGKTPEVIRETFNIENDRTPEEEEKVRRENQWAFQ